MITGHHMASPTAGGDFIHRGNKRDGQTCPRGRIRTIINDDGYVFYVCQECGKKWKTGKAEEAGWEDAEQP